MKRCKDCNMFRAQRVDNGKLIEGYYCKASNEHLIIVEGAQLVDPTGGICIKIRPDYYIMGYRIILPESLAMATGVKDKDGVEIYGSILVDGKMSEGGDEIKGLNGFGEPGTAKVWYTMDGGFYPLCEAELAWRDIEIIKNENEKISKHPG